MKRTGSGVGGFGVSVGMDDGVVQGDAERSGVLKWKQGQNPSTPSTKDGRTDRKTDKRKGYRRCFAAKKTHLTTTTASKEPSIYMETEVVPCSTCDVPFSRCSTNKRFVSSDSPGGANVVRACLHDIAVCVGGTASPGLAEEGVAVRDAVDADELGELRHHHAQCRLLARLFDPAGEVVLKTSKRTSASRA